MAVRVEPMREADIPACLEIYNRYVLHTSVSPEEQALTLAQYRQRVEEVLTQHNIYYTKSEVWIESERLYEVLYIMEV